MIVEFNFDVGDFVYFLFENKIRVETVREVRFGKYSQMENIERCKYYYLTNRSTIPYRENEIFYTEDDLLESLKTN